MTTKSPAAPKKAAAPKTDKKDDKNPAPKGAAVPKTGELKLEGGKDAKTVGLDNKTTIKEPVPPEVIAAARLFAEAKVRVEYHQVDAADKGDKFLDVALKHGISRKAKIRIETDRGPRFISLRDVVQVQFEKAAAKAN